MGFPLSECQLSPVIAAELEQPAVGRQAALGITAKSSTPSITVRAARAERYRALSTARYWVGRLVARHNDYEKRLHGDKARLVEFPGDRYRVFDCRHARTSMFVDVMTSPAYGTAHYKNLATCGSVWACPVCASRIQERRRLEIEHLIDWAHSQGLQCIMVTLTFPHQHTDTLSDLLALQSDAFKRFRAGGPFRRFKESIGFRGLVRSLELTHGKNGWHPHTHELWLVDPQVSAIDVQDRLVHLWERACLASGLLRDHDDLDAFRKHSVDVRYNASCGDYLAKQDSSRAWGVSHEVAKASSKKGRLAGVHPHEFLIRRAKGDRARFFEYVDAMKGKRQLFWSHGLKDLCGLDEVTDEVIADESREEADLLGSLTVFEWELIRKAECRSHVLDLAEHGGWPAVLRFLSFLSIVNQGVAPLGDGP